MKQFIKKNQEKIKLISYCFLLSFVFLIITSQCSFFYPFNDWVDANAFFTVGKSLMHGVVPYLDIFEQKGILLYLIYGLGYLLSNTTFHGIFILEVLAWTFSLYYAFKTITLFISKKNAYLILPIFLLLLTTSKAFVYGGSAEEFCMPFLLLTLYYFLKHFKKEELTYKEITIAGLCAGCVLSIKYTILGFWFGFMACIFFHLFFQKKYQKSFLSCVWFLIGMFTPMLITLIYMGICGGIKEFFEVYFIDNLTLYANDAPGLGSKIFKLFSGFVNEVKKNGPIIFILVIGYIILLWKLNIQRNSKKYLFFIYFFTILGIYFGLRFYDYYLFPILVFSLISLIVLFSFCEKKVNNLTSKKYAILISILVIICTGGCFTTNNRHLLFEKKESLFQFDFAKIIMEEKNPTMVNMGFLDCGVYTITNIVPTTYFFEKQNYSYEKFPDNVDAFKEYIKNKETMFIIYYTEWDFEKVQEEEKELFENYDLIKSANQDFENRNYNAYLFKVKEV